MKLLWHTRMCRLTSLALPGIIRRSFTQSTTRFDDTPTPTPIPPPEKFLETTPEKIIITPTGPREFMNFSDIHIEEYIKHLNLTADEFKRLQRQKMPAIKCDTKEKDTKDEKAKPKTLMPLQEIMPGVLEGIETSYKFQNRVIETMKKQGVDVIGWRVQGTNRTFLKQWALTAPVVAPVFATMVYRDGEELSINKHKIMHMEVNFAFRLGKDMNIDDVAPKIEKPKELIPGEEEPPIEVPIDTIISYVDAFFPAIDFTSTRYPVRAPHSSAYVADFTGGSAVALGEPLPVDKWKQHSMANHPTILYLGDEPIAVGRGEVVLGNPLASIPYVANNCKITRSTTVLEKGSTVLTGGCTTPYVIKPGKYTAHFGPFGKVAIQVNE